MLMQERDLNIKQEIMQLMNINAVLAATNEVIINISHKVEGSFEE